MQSSNIKETWKILNGIIKNKKLTQSIQIHFIHENKSVNSKMDISNGFNKLFVYIGPDVEKKVYQILQIHTYFCQVVMQRRLVIHYPQN